MVMPSKSWLRAVKVGLLQPLFEAGHGHAGGGVGVHDAMRALDAAVEGGVHHEASRVHTVRGRVQHLALQVDLDQVACGDFAVVQPERVDQELLFIARNAIRQAQRDVVVDHLGPAQMGEHAVAGGQLYAGGPFVGVHAWRFGRTGIDGQDGVHGSVPSLKIKGQYTLPLGRSVEAPNLNRAASALVWRASICVSRPTATNTAPNAR